MASPISRIMHRVANTRLYSSQAAMASATTPKVSHVNDIPLVALQNGSNLARVTVAVKSGARYEDSSNFGITHLLRHWASTSNRGYKDDQLFFDLQRCATNLQVNTTKENTYYTVEFLKEFADSVLPYILSIGTRTAVDGIDWGNYKGMKPNMEADSAVFKSQLNIRAFELLHKAAFRTGLGNSMWATEDYIGSYSPAQVEKFLSQYHQLDRVAVISDNVPAPMMVSFINEYCNVPKLEFPADKKTTYLGGELRDGTPGDKAYVYVATEGPSLTSKDLVAAAVFQHIMGVGSKVKYNKGSGRIDRAVKDICSSPAETSCINVNYSDSGLFGWAVSAYAEDSDKICRAIAKEFASITKSGLTADDVAKGKKSLMLDCLMEMESRETEINVLAEQTLLSQPILSAAQWMEMIESVTKDQVVEVAKKLITGKPSMGACGNLVNTPLLHELV